MPGLVAASVLEGLGAIAGVLVLGSAPLLLAAMIDLAFRRARRRARARERARRGVPLSHRVIAELMTLAAAAYANPLGPLVYLKGRLHGSPHDA
jgi:hypothetical protein